MTQNLIVVDLEATCWPDKDRQRSQSEIIEIGVAKIYLPNLEIKDKWTYIIKPQHSEISEFCTELTSITQEMVNKGVTLRQAAEDLINKHDSQHCVWASYGNYDRSMMERECKAKNVDYPFSPSHINVKDIVRVATGGKVGMEKAMKALGLVMEGRHHRGVDDAYNTARICQLLFKRLRAS